MNSGEPGSRVGSRLGPYRLLRSLGRGGMGEVYEAVHETGDTREQAVVALKLISEQFSGNATFRTRMQRQAEAVQRLAAPHVVPILGHGEIDGLMYVEMRLIDGTDLATLLSRSGPLSPARTVAIVRQVAGALDAAHLAGVMHRDVRPKNILVTDDDVAFLVDFGIATCAADLEVEQTEASVRGYDYLAPEQLAGDPVDDPADDEVTDSVDVYALAAVLAECLTGSAPYPAAGVEEAVEARRTVPPPRPSRLRPGRVPAALDEVVARGLAENPEERYGRAADLAIAAHEALTEPERHQVGRILRRGESVPPPRPDTAETKVQPVLSPVTPSVWAPPAVDEPESAWTPPGHPFPVNPARGTSLGTLPFLVGESPWHKRRPVLIGAALLVAVAVVFTIAHLVTRPSQALSVSVPRQTVLPFNDLNFRLAPGGVAVDGEGAVYVTSRGMHGRVVKLPAGSTTPTVLPLTGLHQPQGLAVDTGGTMYFSDLSNRVLKLAAGSSTLAPLAFSGLDGPAGVAVDASGNVYVVDRGNNNVVKLEAASNNQTVLAFSGLNDPDGVAVDRSGNVYVTDTGNSRVVKLTAGSSEQVVLPFTGIITPWGVAVDEDGTVYVTEHDNNKVVKLRAGSMMPTVLPFTGLNTPSDVALDRSGNVYVADRGNDRVVEVAAG